MKQYHNRFLLSFENFKYLKQVSYILKHQQNKGKLSFEKIFQIYPNNFLNSALYLISPIIVLFSTLYKFTKVLLQSPHIIDNDFWGKRLFLNNNTSFYMRTREQLHQDDVILSFQTPLRIEGFRNIEITELVTIRNSISAFGLSIQSLWYLIRNCGYWSCMYALNAFDCYLLMIALDNLPIDITLITDAQIDRLAYIVDSAKQKNKEIIMHGSLFIHGEPPETLLPYVIYDNKRVEWCYDMPVRLKMIGKVYAFSQKEGNYFRLCTMISEASTVIVEVGYGTKFSKIPKSNRNLDILLVANDTMLLTETKMCHLFFKNGYNIFIQIHPLSDSSKYTTIVNHGIAKVVANNQKNPLVDVVVSYGSTLAHEYEAIDIPVIYYTDYIENNILNEVELIKAINKHEKS